MVSSCRELTFYNTLTKERKKKVPPGGVESYIGRLLQLYPIPMRSTILPQATTKSVPGNKILEYATTGNVSGEGRGDPLTVKKYPIDSQHSRGYATSSNLYNMEYYL